MECEIISSIQSMTVHTSQHVLSFGYTAALHSFCWQKLKSMPEPRSRSKQITLAQR